MYANEPHDARKLVPLGVFMSLPPPPPTWNYYIIQKPIVLTKTWLSSKAFWVSRDLDF